MLYIGYLMILGGHNVKKFGNSIAFGKSTSQRIYHKAHTHTHTQPKRVKPK